MDQPNTKQKPRPRPINSNGLSRPIYHQPPNWIFLVYLLPTTGNLLVVFSPAVLQPTENFAGEPEHGRGPYRRGCGEADRRMSLMTKQEDDHRAGNPKGERKEEESKLWVLALFGFAGATATTIAVCGCCYLFGIWGCGFCKVGLFFGFELFLDSKHVLWLLGFEN